MFRKILFTPSLFMLLFTGRAFSQKQVSDDKSSVKFFLNYTNPEFFDSPDSLLQKKNMDKYYSLYSYLYAQQEKDGISKQDQQLLDSLCLYIRKRYVAESYLTQMAKNDTVTQDEVFKYYQQHQTDYKEPAECTYYQIIMMKEDDETIEKAKKKVMELAAEPDTLLPYKGDKNSFYSISYERKVKLMPSYKVTSVLEQMAPLKFSELLQIPGFNFRVMYYVVARKESKVKPFTEVEEDCRNKARARELQTELDKIYSKARTEFPAILNR